MRIILISIIAFTSLSMMGQQGRHGHHDGRHNSEHHRMSAEKLEAQKIAYFTKQLDLTPTEAQNFWPLHNEYSAKKKEMHIKRRERPNLENLNDEEANKLIDEFMARKQAELELDKTYIEKFKLVLPPQKVIKVFMLERKFREEMLKDVRRRLNHSK